MTTATPPTPRRYKQREVDIKNHVNAIAEKGKPFARPVTPSQVRKVLNALGELDPFAKGGPLEGWTRAEADRVALNGGHSPKVATVSRWKKAQRPAVRNDANLYNRRIVAILIASTRID